MEQGLTQPIDNVIIAVDDSDDEEEEDENVDVDVNNAPIADRANS